jgi:cytochrome o ubiquinol oxidase subunit 3
MSNLVTNAGHAHGDHGHDDHHHDSGEMTVYGFWLYLMTDCILFASIFAGTRCW